MAGGRDEDEAAPSGGAEAAPAPVDAHLSGQRFPLLDRTIVVAVIVGLLAFLSGYQLGHPHEAEPSPNASPVIRPVVVSDALRDAYAAAGGGDWTVCVVDGAPRCLPLAHQPGGPAQPGSYTFRFCTEGLCLSQVDPGSLPWTWAPGGHLVLVAPLAADAGRALLFRWDEPGRVPPSVAIEGVDPRAAGTYYFDLGDLAAGRDMVVVSALLPSTVDRAGSYAEWTTYLAGLVVTPPRS